MDFNFQALFWYILAADCAFANVVAWFYQVGTGQVVLLFLNIFPLPRPWCVGICFLFFGWVALACETECSPLVVIFKFQKISHFIRLTGYVVFIRFYHEISEVFFIILLFSTVYFLRSPTFC